ncbi:MAG TPA: TIGR03067 domain-containing protein [Gemmataceae bacterium]|nr:TIGR03067 domain-containing protein [Gemmataceae bacterium]
MSRIILLGTLAGAIAWAANSGAQPPPPEPKSDLGKMQGRWYYNRVQQDGGELELKGETVVTVSGEKLSIDRDGVAVLAGTVTLEPKAKPKALDLKLTAGESSGKVIKGIYNYDGMTLQIVLGKAGGERPTAFQTVRGDGNTAVTLKQAEPKK